MIRLRKNNIFLTIIVTYLLYYLFYRTKSISPKNIQNVIPTVNKRTILTGINGCSVINYDYKQHTVLIDGVLYPQYLYLSQNKSINYDCLNNSVPLKKILAWNTFYGEEYMGYGPEPVAPFKKKNCPITNCQVLNDRKRVNESDFVIMLMTDSIAEKPPKYRPPNQRWVYANIESPYYHPQSYKEWNGFFNLTADYLTESEFGLNYESQKRFLWAKNETFDSSHDYHEGKTGFMVALISNCRASNKRLEYIEELRKYVNVSIYGGCGSPCPLNIDCREFVGRRFKFYFAYENSNCKDYITEKFFLMLKYDIIPVVVGGGNYSRFIPKSGYINAMNFPSPYHLASYLKYVDSNKMLFNSYFKWKRHVNFLEHTVEYAFICEMCIQLHLEHFFGVKKKIINDFDSYWNKNSQCTDVKMTQIESIKYFEFNVKIN